MTNLAEGEVVLLQRSPFVFKLEFSVECHLTHSLHKCQPVLEVKSPQNETVVHHIDTIMKFENTPQNFQLLLNSDMLFS